MMSHSIRNTTNLGKTLPVNPPNHFCFQQWLIRCLAMHDASIQLTTALQHENYSVEIEVLREV